MKKEPTFQRSALCLFLFSPRRRELQLLREEEREWDPLQEEERG